MSGVHLYRYPCGCIGLGDPPSTLIIGRGGRDVTLWPAVLVVEACDEHHDEDGPEWFHVSIEVEDGEDDESEPEQLSGDKTCVHDLTLPRLINEVNAAFREQRKLGQLRELLRGEL